MVDIVKEGGVHPHTPPWADFTLKKEITPESDHCHSAYSVEIPLDTERVSQCASLIQKGRGWGEQPVFINAVKLNPSDCEENT